MAFSGLSGNSLLAMTAALFRCGVKTWLTHRREPPDAYGRVGGRAAPLRLLSGRP